jgi:hypothetical protein
MPAPRPRPPISTPSWHAGLHHLIAVAPKLRGRDAARRVEILLTEDAQAATAGARATDRSSRRLFDRLVAIGAARELTGRPTFRLYGL